MRVDSIYELAVTCKEGQMNFVRMSRNVTDNIK